MMIKNTDAFDNLSTKLQMRQHNRNLLFKKFEEVKKYTFKYLIW